MRVEAADSRGTSAGTRGTEVDEGAACKNRALPEAVLARIRQSTSRRGRSEEEEVFENYGKGRLRQFSERKRREGGEREKRKRREEM